MDSAGLFNALSAALGHGPAQRAAEAALAEMAGRPGFCSALTHIASARDAAPHAVRHLASVQLKNTVTRHWRTASAAALTDQEKAALRPALVALLTSEPDQAVALQAALSLARAARVDWPRAWPGLVTDLAAACVAGGNTHDLAARRARLGLHHVLRELAAKRLAPDRAAFSEAAARLLPGLWPAWCAETRLLVDALPAALAAADAGQAPPAATAKPPPPPDAWLLGLKVCRRLLIAGCQDGPAVEARQPVGEALAVLVQALQAVAAALGAAAAAAGGRPPPPSPGRAAACTAALNLLKSVRKLAEAHPWACLASGALPDAMRVCGSLLAGGEGLAGVVPAEASPPGSRGTTPPQPPSPSWPAAAAAAARTSTALATQAMVAVKAALDALDEAAPGSLAGGGGADGAPPQPTAGRGGAPRLAALRAAVAPHAAALAATLLGPDGGGLRSLVDVLIDGHLPLTHTDVDEWGADPEEWAVGAVAASAAWRDAPRGAAEVLLAAAVKAAPRVLAPALVARLRAACAACPAGQARAVAAAGCGGGRAPSPTSRPALPPPILAREAAAAAACVTAYDLHDAFPPPAVAAWVRAELLPDLAAYSAGPPPPSCSPDPAAVLARRAALALSAFVASLSREDQALAYAPLATALTGPDASVGLAAVKALRTLVDDWNFSEDDFARHAPAVIAGLGSLLGAGPSAASPPAGPPAVFADLDSQGQAAAALHLVIDRLAGGAACDAGGGGSAAAALAACAPPVLAILPSLWAGPDGAGGRPAGAGATPLLRLQALATEARLVNALGPDYFARADPAAAGPWPPAAGGGGGGAAAGRGVLLPMLAAALSDPAAPDSAALAPDALALLVAALRNAPTGAPCPGLVSLLPAALALAAEATDAAPAALAAAASAALLSPSAVASPPVAPAVSALFTSLGPALNARGCAILYAAADAVAAACPPATGWPILRGLAVHAAAALMARPCDVDTTVGGAAAALLARLTLHSPGGAAEVAADAARASPEAAAGVAALPPGSHPVAAVAAALADRYDSLPASGSRRLIAHALCALLSSGAPGVAAQLPALAASVTAAAAEEESAASTVAGGGGGGCDRGGCTDQFLFDALASALVAGGDGAAAEWAALDDSSEAAPESERRAALRASAPTAGRTVGDALRAAAAAAGAGPDGAAFSTAAAALDPAVAAAMNAAMAQGGR